MSEHNRKKRLENTKRYKSKAWKHLAFQPVETTASTAAAGSSSLTSSTRPTQEPPSKSSRLHPNRPDSAEPSDSPSPGQLPLEENEGPSVTETTNYPPVSAANVDGYAKETAPQSQAIAPIQTSSPWAFLGPGMKDPFDTGHTQLSGRMYQHLQHFLCDLTRLAYPLQRRYGAKLEAHWSTLVRQCPACLQASICVAATNSALTSGELPLTDPSRQKSSLLLLDTFRHRGETIRFADVPDDVRFQISWTDIRVACMSLTKPIFPFVRHSHPENFTITPPSTDLEATASGLVALVEIPGIFSDAIRKIMYDLAGLLWYAEWIKSSPKYQEFDEQTERYYNTEVLYVEYALHSDRYTATGEPKGDATIEGCVRLACLLFHNTTIWDFYPQIAPVFPKPIIALQMALETTIRAGRYHLCRDLLIWLLFVGACSSRILVAQRTFFVNELASAVRLQGVGSWQELRALLFRYFYVDRCYLGPLRELWDEIQTTPVINSV
ncbi:hypothetical protein ARAM_006166 [Aspergillus rambellii]|uniref:Uncharacterized protein n=1 Tax=Aspergillus rambellii TaxID=308745 RepID=A0A0F8UVN4_9EURO|nr:hypothetical protein ARAM_006166 [Aspergillus rambellii]